ncbi:MAG: response regulator [Deltaproteobacteria bacterium]|nr:response regulator [Deltaproteobacteria bacterium]MBW2362520.1 response regulator [Deltaproteobacteria bacterium]
MLPQILVVDDVPMFVELESMFLSGCGSVRTASNGREALEALAASPIDVAVVDFRLPDTTGDVLCRELRELAGDPTLPVVLVSSGDAAEHALAVRAGASDVISKPVSRTALVGAVSRMLVPGGPRGLPRIPCDTPARLRGADLEIEGRVVNLSRGGLFVRADWLPPQGSEFTVEFTLPDDDTPLAPTATAVWRQPGKDRSANGFGMRFLELDGATLNALDGYVHERYSPSATDAWAGALS